MKIQLKTEVKDVKTFAYVLHTIEVTEASILDWLNLERLFISPDWGISKWEEKMLRLDIANYPSFKNVKENSFNLEIDDCDNKVLEHLKEFLTENELSYEI